MQVKEMRYKVRQSKKVGRKASGTKGAGCWVGEQAKSLTGFSNCATSVAKCAANVADAAAP